MPPNRPRRQLHVPHVSLTIEGAVGRFRSAAARITANGNLTADEKEAIGRWTRLCLNGVPETYDRGYQAKLQKAISFINLFTGPDREPELGVLIKVAFLRDDLASMNSTTRNGAVERLLRARCSGRCR